MGARRRGGGGRGGRGCRRDLLGVDGVHRVSRDPSGPVRRLRLDENGRAAGVAHDRPRVRVDLEQHRAHDAEHRRSLEHVCERQRAGEEGNDRALPEPQVVAERMRVGVRHPAVVELRRRRDRPDRREAEERTRCSTARSTRCWASWPKKCGRTPADGAGQRDALIEQ